MTTVICPDWCIVQHDADRMKLHGGPIYTYRYAASPDFPTEIRVARYDEPGNVRAAVVEFRAGGQDEYVALTPDEAWALVESGSYEQPVAARLWVTADEVRSGNVAGPR